MNPYLLRPVVQTYIQEHITLNTDLNTLILAGSPFPEVTIQELAQQIQGRRKAKYKLPTWHAALTIYYPPKLNLEQTSSERTADYKSIVVSGDTLVDLTGGFGIDDFYFAKVMQKVVHCEMNELLSEIAAHNFNVLGSTNISTYSGDGLQYIQNADPVDWIYIDPSRRHEKKGKVFFLEDCLPNVPENLDLLFTKSSHILIKTAPLLDLHAGISSLRHVKAIHIVAVQNEVKELLWVLDAAYTDEIIQVYTVNRLEQYDQEFSFTLQEERTVSHSYSLPKKYLYEPNSAILKSGGFSSVTQQYDVKKLQQHSHLYTSDHISDFPGRSFEILEIHPYQKKSIKQLGIEKANITTRNFPESVETLRKKFKIKDGGELFLFFTTDCTHQKIMLKCKKIK